MSKELETRQAEVIKSGTGQDAYRLAYEYRHHPKLDRVALQFKVLYEGDAWDAFDFARDIPGSNVKALRRKVLASGNSTAIGRFGQWDAAMAHVEGKAADQRKAASRVLERPLSWS